ncbi:MAG: RibD family protein, partial [Candidatus Dormibacteraeota bacterium]|nr:RibD family protein [Candidatus Dormibacteraeota bacterium]
ASAASSRVDPRALLELLGRRQILSVLVEGGATVNASFVEAGLVDEVVAFVAPTILGGTTAPGPVAGSGAASPGDGLRLRHLQVTRLGEDLMIRGECSQE